MWLFLKEVELLVIVAFILGFLAKDLGRVFKSLETFFKEAEPSLADWSDGETTAAIEQPIVTPPASPPINPRSP
jgi:hypothetical protein